jgi:hypothetical protein
MEREMNWTAIGAVAELIAAIGVIASLVYVGFQIRQNTLSVTASAHRAINDKFISVNEFIAKDAETIKAFLAGRERLEELNEVDTGRFIAIMMNILLHFEDVFYQHRQGLVGDQYWERIERMIGLYVTEPGVQGYWSIFKEWSTDDFREYLDSRFAEAGPARIGREKTVEMEKLGRGIGSGEGADEPSEAHDS